MAPYNQKVLTYGTTDPDKPASVFISNRINNEISVGVEVPTPEESEWLKQHGVDLPKVSDATADPRSHSDYVDNILNAVGFGIYLGGYLLYLDGFEMPVFVPESHFDFSVTGSNAADLAIYDSYSQAMDHVPIGPPAPGKALPHAYYRGAGGKVIAPTLFTEDTTPRVIKTAIEAKRLLGKTVSTELTYVALNIIGAMVLKAIIGIVARITSGKSVMPLSPNALKARAMAKEIHAQGKPVIANMGGAGAAHEPQGAININNQSVGRKDIPNLIENDASDIGILFEKETLDQVVGHRMAPSVISWRRAIPGIKSTLKSGGSFRFDWRWSTPEAAEVTRLLEAHGFKDVKNYSDVVVTAVK
jgi:hypothetical protein